MADDNYKLPLCELVPIDWNPRMISAEAMSALRNSIVTGTRNHKWDGQGFRLDTTITVNRNGNRIIGGHQRVKALRELGQDWIHRDDITWVEIEPNSPEEKARNLVLNNQYATGDWTESVFDVLKDVKDFELPDVGDVPEALAFGSLEDFLSVRFETDGNNSNGNAEIIEPPTPDPPKEPVTKVGDLWILGDHRLLCGNSTIKNIVDRLMCGEKAGLFATDPPYGVDYSKVKNGIPRSGFEHHTEDWGNMSGDSLEGKNLQEFLSQVFTNVLPHLDKAAWYLWHAHLTQGFFAAAAAAEVADVLLHRQIIWKKPGFVLTRSGMYHWSHEPCFYGWVRGQQPKWLGNRSQTTVWECGRDTNVGHPTQKPIELFVIPIENHLEKGDICCDPFVGSGSQLMAAEQLDRRCFAMEIEPKYCDVVVERWENLTGQKAKRETK